MMILAADTLNIIGTVFGGVASVMGGYALIKARRTDDKSATREDMRLALESRDKMLDRYEKTQDKQDQRILNLETENLRMREQVDSAMTKAEDAEIHQRICEQDLKVVRNELRIAQARISELGG